MLLKICKQCDCSTESFNSNITVFLFLFVCKLKLPHFAIKRVIARIMFINCILTSIIVNNYFFDIFLINYNTFYYYFPPPWSFQHFIRSEIRVQWMALCFIRPAQLTSQLGKPKLTLRDRAPLVTTNIDF